MCAHERSHQNSPDDVDGEFRDHTHEEKAAVEVAWTLHAKGHFDCEADHFVLVYPVHRSQNDENHVMEMDPNACLNRLSRKDHITYA